MPTHEEIAGVRHGYYRIAHFPNCIGAIDCIHVKIEASVKNMQKVSDMGKTFLSINVITVTLLWLDRLVI